MLKSLHGGQGGGGGRAYSIKHGDRKSHRLRTNIRPNKIIVPPHFHMHVIFPPHGIFFNNKNIQFQLS